MDFNYELENFFKLAYVDLSDPYNPFTVTVPGFLLLFYDTYPIHITKRTVEIDEWFSRNAEYGDDLTMGEMAADGTGMYYSNYWSKIRPIGKVAHVNEQVKDMFEVFSSQEALDRYLTEEVYDGHVYNYATEGYFTRQGNTVGILKKEFCPVAPSGANWVVVCCWFSGWGHDYFNPRNPRLNDLTSGVYSYIYYSDCREPRNGWPYYSSNRRFYVFPCTGGAKIDQLVFSSATQYEPRPCPDSTPYVIPKWRDTWGDVFNGPRKRFGSQSIGQTVHGIQKCEIHPRDAHVPKSTNFIWPGTYKDNSSAYAQLCTKEDLDPNHEGEWPEPSEGGQYSYPGPWDCHNLYAIGEDWEHVLLPYASGIDKDSLNTYRRRVSEGIRNRTYACYMPPSTSRGWGTSTRYRYGLEANQSVFGLELPNIMVSQDGYYHDTAPVWDLRTGTYAQLLNGDLAEVSIPHSWGAPLIPDDHGGFTKDWDIIAPMSWYYFWRGGVLPAKTDDYNLDNSLYVSVQAYPGERILQRDQKYKKNEKTSMIEWPWPEQKSKEEGETEIEYKDQRLGLVTKPWIPCVIAITAEHYASIRTSRLLTMEEQENLFRDDAERTAQDNQYPADRTVTYCDEILIHGVKYDGEFFQGTQPPTADSLHHAPDMSGEIANDVWFNPSKVFGRSQTDRQNAYLPPLAFNFNYIREDRKNSRVFYPTAKGFIRATYTSKSKSVMQEISDYYASEGECTLQYISPSRKAYIAKQGETASPRSMVLTSPAYASQSLVDDILSRLSLVSQAAITTNTNIPLQDIIPQNGTTAISIDLNQNVVTITEKSIN